MPASDVSPIPIKKQFNKIENQELGNPKRKFKPQTSRLELVTEQLLVQPKDKLDICGTKVPYGIHRNVVYYSCSEVFSMQCGYVNIIDVI